MDRPSDNFLAKPCRVLLCAACLSGIQPAVAASLQDHQSIQATARSFIAKRHPWQGMRVDIEAGSLDNRTRLPRCQSRLEAFLPPGGRIRQHTTVGVRCSDAKKWKIYLPVTVKAYAEVLVARHAMPPGTVLDTGDVQTAQRDIASLGYGYVSSLDENGGLRTRLSVAQGAVITPNMVESAVMIRRGQHITVLSHQGPVSVSMAGEALADASLGDRIRVRNVNSGRVLEGIVRSDEVVEVQ